MLGPHAFTTRAAALLTVLGLALVGGCAEDGVTDLALQPIPDQTVAVGAELQVELVVTNTGGANPQFTAACATLPDLMGRPSRPAFAPFGAGAFMRWTPLGTDVGQHVIEIRATTAAGTTTGVFNVDIVPGEAAPVFLKPLGSGKTLDLGRERCARVDVEVEDSDTPMVRIALERPIEENYEFEMKGPSKGEFEFCPTEQQITKADQYTVNFAADDEDGHITRKKFAIVLRRTLGQNCEGEAPSIQHLPPEEQTTRGPITFTAEVTDDIGVEGEPKLYYSLETQSPNRGIDVDRFTPVGMRRIGGNGTNGTYEASVPSPVEMDEPGVTRSMYYFIEATDNDDMRGNCDHRTTLPDNNLFVLQVRAPERDVGAATCGECSRDADCQSGLCVRVGSGNYCVDACAQSAPESCGSLTEAGCCDGNILAFCNAGRVTQLNCADRPSCGWNASESIYDCQTAGGEDPSGRVPIACPFAGCPAGTTCSGRPVTTVDGDQELVCMPDSGQCVGGGDPGPGPGPGPGPDPAPACIDDVFEENDSINDVGTDIEPGTYRNLRLCGDGIFSDDDFYPIFVGDATELSVQLDFLHADGDIDLSLKDEEGVTFLGSVSSTDNEELSTCLSDGLYYINVWSVDGGINAAYDMSIELGRCCLDDAREDRGDDNAQTATVVGPGEEYPDGQICENDEDWYVIDLFQGDTLDVVVLFDHDGPEDDLDVFVLDPAELIVGSGVSFTSDEEVNVTAVMSGPHYIRVRGHMGSTNSYHIGFDVLPFEP